MRRRSLAGLAGLSLGVPASHLSQAQPLPLDAAVATVLQAYGLPVGVCASDEPVMFMVTEADAAAIRTAFDEAGELSAAIELRRRFPGITDNAEARACARTIAGWNPPATAPCSGTRLHPGKNR